MNDGKEEHAKPIDYATPDLPTKTRREAEEYYREQPDVLKCLAMVAITLSLAVLGFLYFVMNWF